MYLYTHTHIELLIGMYVGMCVGMYVCMHACMQASVYTLYLQKIRYDGPHVFDTPHL